MFLFFIFLFVLRLNASLMNESSCNLDVIWKGTWDYELNDKIIICSRMIIKEIYNKKIQCDNYFNSSYYFTRGKVKNYRPWRKIFNYNKHFADKYLLNKDNDIIIRNIINRIKKEAKKR